MKQEKGFLKVVTGIALPVTLQSLLQSSFSVVDQMMIGSLGSSRIAGVGLGAKFASIYSVLLGAVAAAAGIMISQYMGQKDEREVSRSFFSNLFFSLILAAVFWCAGMLFPGQIMGLYTKDAATRVIAGEYLRILSFSFVPMALSLLAATLLRCMEAAVFPMLASLVAAVVNTLLNYLLIFGKGGFPKLGAAGAAIATVTAQTAACVATLIFLAVQCRKRSLRLSFLWRFRGDGRRQYLSILGPIVICEFLWSLGENVYAAIYGNMGTSACAAVTLTIPIQSLLIGALSGLSQAAGILIGKELGAEEYDKAYRESKLLMLYGFCGSLILSFSLMLFGKYYVEIYQVEETVKLSARQVLTAFALISPVKVQNMILGGGIVRSGGMTKYIMWVDFIGTWLFGVPLGYLAAFVWKFPIAEVYFMLSLEECVRFLITLVIFKKKKWMRKL